MSDGMCSNSWCSRGTTNATQCDPCAAAHEAGRREGVVSVDRAVAALEVVEADGDAYLRRGDVGAAIARLLPAPPQQAAGPPETCSMCGDPVRYVAKHLNPSQPNLYCYRESDGYAFVHCKNAQAVRRGDYPPPAPPAAPATTGEACKDCGASNAKACPVCGAFTCDGCAENADESCCPAPIEAPGKGEG